MLDQRGGFTRLDSFPLAAVREGIGLTEDRAAEDENLTFEKKNILPMIRIGDPATPRLPWTLFM
ncbi:MAG: hypothetical protein ACYS47_09400, partial [Planctomycetota bacterium]